MRQYGSDMNTLMKELNKIEYQLNRNRGFSNNNRNINFKKEEIQRLYPIENMKPNDDHFRHIVKNEFIKMFNHEMEKISKTLGMEINNNKLKIANIEKKLLFIQPFIESINDSKKNTYNEKSNMIDKDNFLKKDEFEKKMNKIKTDILGEINMINQQMNFSLNIQNEINKLKQNYENIESQINTMKEHLNKILIQNSNLNKESTSDGRLETMLFDYKNEINSKIENIFSNYKYVIDIINEFKKNIKKNKEDIRELKENIDEINNNINMYESIHKIESINKEVKNDNNPNDCHLKQSKYKITSLNNNLGNLNKNLNDEQSNNSYEELNNIFNDEESNNINDEKNNNLNDEKNNNFLDNLKKEKYKVTSINEELNYNKSNLKKEKYLTSSIEEEYSNNNSQN